ncbi:MAG: potassium/proton antiporter [Oceanococcaceae bacterium]
MELSSSLLLLAGVLLTLSLLATLVTPRLGVPLLVVFLVLGMLAGEDGVGGIPFDDFALANLACTTALAVILFDGGMRTPLAQLQLSWGPALSLATFGVAVTAGVTGLFASWLLGLDLLQGLLLGAIVGSTDAAAVFALLSARSLSLNRRVSATLEVESGSNDPMAIFLTLLLIGLLNGQLSDDVLTVSQLFIQQMGLGLLLGVTGGALLAQALNRLGLSDTMTPLLALAGALLLFGITATLGGSGFLAVYVAGLLVGHRRPRGLGGVLRFHDGVAWLAQIGMFIILGMLATPSELLRLAAPAVAIALCLILVARPLAVGLGLLPFRLPWREQSFIAWVGLRGSVPILLATYPILAGLPEGEMYFNIAFVIVLVSLIVQGSSLAGMARLLGLFVPQNHARLRRVEIDLPGTTDHEIVSYRLPARSAHSDCSLQSIGLPEGVRVITLSRGSHVLPTPRKVPLAPGDYISLLCHRDQVDDLDRLFEASAAARQAAQTRFFGEFVICGDAPVADLVALYQITVPTHATTLTCAEFLSSALPHPVIGDRLHLGNADLVVHGMQGLQITEVGLRLSP